MQSLRERMVGNGDGKNFNSRGGLERATTLICSKNKKEISAAACGGEKAFSMVL